MQYRPEIDGLRAVAVLPVIFYHAGLNFFDGGYVGVDIFFIISGYLITTILITDLEIGKFNLLSFYERRARRILPALFLVMILTSLISFIFMSPGSMKSFSQSQVATSLFLSNFLFLSQADYFTPLPEIMPLIHTWSLAVEEQYYVFFPIFLILTWKYGTRLIFWLILLIALLSFISSEWGWRNYPIQNFYLTTSRAWEILLGSLIAFVINKVGQRNNNFLSLFGLLLISFSIFTYDESMPFPSIYTFVPVLGTLLIILYAGKDTFVARILSIKLLVSIGLIGYSLYLFHQPVFSLARIIGFSMSNNYTFITLFCISVLLAALSYKFIEQPFRKSENKVLKNKTYFLLFSLFFTLLFIGLGLLGNFTNGFDHRLTTEQKKILEWEKYDYRSKYLEGECFLTSDQNYEDFKNRCQGTGKIFIWGDSYAAALASGWRLVDPSISQYTIAGCPPIFDYNFHMVPNCKETNENIFKLLEQNQDSHLIIQANWMAPVYQVALPDFLNTIERLKNSGIDAITIIGGVPQYFPALPQQLSLNKESLSNTHKMKSANIIEIIKADESLKKLSKENKIKFVSIIDEICVDDKCDAIIKNNENQFIPITWDYGHSTEGGAEYIVRKFIDKIH